MINMIHFLSHTDPCIYIIIIIIVIIIILYFIIYIYMYYIYNIYMYYIIYILYIILYICIHQLDTGIIHTTTANLLGNRSVKSQDVARPLGWQSLPSWSVDLGTLVATWYYIYIYISVLRIFYRDIDIVYFNVSMNCIYIYYIVTCLRGLVTLD